MFAMMILDWKISTYDVNFRFIMVKGYIFEAQLGIIGTCNVQNIIMNGVSSILYYIALIISFSQSSPFYSLVIMSFNHDFKLPSIKSPEVGLI